MLSAFFWSCSYWLTMYSTLLLWRVNGLSGFVRYSQLWHSFYGTVMQSSFLKPLWLSWKPPLASANCMLLQKLCNSSESPVVHFCISRSLENSKSTKPTEGPQWDACLKYSVWDKCRTPCCTKKLQKLNGHSLFSCSDSFERYGIGNYWVFLIWIRNP